MSRSVRLSEYYDLFDVKTYKSGSTPHAEVKNNDILNDKIQDTNMTNPFHGFSNWTDFKANNQTYDMQNLPNTIPTNIATITGKHFSPQALNTISITDNGDILCYPPNVPVPYWNKVIFRNFDFQFQPHDLDANNTDDFKAISYRNMIEDTYLTHYDNIPISYDSDKSIYAPVPEFIYDNQTPPVYTQLWNMDRTANTHIPAIYQRNFEGAENVKTLIYNYDNVPLFLRFPEYRSRSHVIFSACDKTRNPDIEHEFGYQHGATEPILLNLSMSASNFITDITTAGTKYNENLDKNTIEKLLIKCYWCIEWVYEAKGVNSD